MRDNNSVRVSRSIKDIAYKAMQVKEKLIAEHQKEPTVEQISRELGIPKSQVVIALESIVEPVSLFDSVYSDGGDTVFVLTNWATAVMTVTGLMKLPLKM